MPPYRERKNTHECVFFSPSPYAAVLGVTAGRKRKNPAAPLDLAGVEAVRQ
jgi:hypothetical protein